MSTAGDACAALEQYEAIAEISALMLGAARQNDWDRLVAEEKRCSELIAGLQARTAAQLSEAERARKSALLRRMLANDAEIRNLAEPWMQNLQDMLASSGNNRKLGESYGSMP